MEVNPNVPAKTVAEFIAYAKANPNKVNLASSGNGTSVHLSGELFMAMTGVKLTHVPNRGSAPALTDMIAGQVQVLFDNLPSSIEHVRAGKLRALAVTGEKRSGVMPDVPTLAEQGLSGFSAYAWWAILAPAGTPRPIIDKFHSELVKVLGQPDLRKQLTETLGMDLQVSSPEGLQKFVVGEVERWGKVVKANNVRAD
jgi:tripartite-type tricarboxylate transporter receptor subunit TctC